MKASLKNTLLDVLRELHLPTVRACYEEEASRSRRERLSYEQYLFEVMSAEQEARRERRITRWLRESKLPLEKSVDTFDMKRLPKGVATQVRTLLDGSFLSRRENVLAFGNPGSGKTHLLCAIGQELIHRGHRVYFSPCSLLVQELLVAKRDLKLSRVLKRLSRYEAILIDDIGYVQRIDSSILLPSGYRCLVEMLPKPRRQICGENGWRAVRRESSCRCSAPATGAGRR